MRINEQLFLRKLKKAFPKGPPNCPICGDQLSWNSNILEMREFNKGAIGKGVVIPVVHATCQSCGHILVFNAIALGLIDKDSGEIIEDDESNERK